MGIISARPQREHLGPHTILKPNMQGGRGHIVSPSPPLEQWSFAQLRSAVQ